jgi:hypothetical protein
MILLFLVVALPVTKGREHALAVDAHGERVATTLYRGAASVVGSVGGYATRSRRERIFAL